ncbi:LLM class flavin-dependent oxidoreductase [Dactylosporangium sucinum]|uniref:FMNH2-utilizing oxygenase n=1 Tax=Dactylosporangium sucinum TaxID=1424081 RepID=A0A917WQS0_9ACTN|nr:LLM class flavin-dependent oxidoreductase [Dactylosporangium sucinum]GGM21872.1 FMNH2-utilizing oxygenase [Dactylosporangium sucinum]
MTQELHLAVALDGAGWHPAAWRAAGARPADLFTTAYWLQLVREAERGTLDLVTIEDSLGLQSGDFMALDGRADRVKGRLDALLIAARIAPVTRHIGLVPTVTTTYTEPFHVSTQLATLDYLSRGRAGWRVQVSGRPNESRHFFGNRTTGMEAIDELFAEAADHVEAVRRLWDSWEDDAEIRDVATGRFVDRDKLHYTDFSGEYFSVKGPSITPRPPQGQPVVTALAHQRVPYEFAAANADVVFVTPADAGQAAAIAAEVRSLTDRPIQVWADVVVFFDAAVKARLDSLDQVSSDAFSFTGTPEQLADLLVEWQAAGLDGFRLRPGVLPADLTAIVDGLVPQLRTRGAFRSAYQETTLRGHLGLPAAPNRYAAGVTA